MATVTPNFNWPVPTSTDLVKDGATAIEALGDSIDASLVDLKGGTTGQVLSKTSGTDMDFTWVTSDDANAIQNSIVDAKGDLISASAADTPARLAVGSNGETLVADSSTATGLKWAAPSAGSSNVAGKNSVLNSNFSCWQRGTSFASAANIYTADRWLVYRSGANLTTSRVATGDTTNLPNIQYAARLQRTASSTSTDIVYFMQMFETVNTIPMVGQSVTLSFYARKGANYSPTSDILTASVRTGTGTDQNWISGYTGETTALTTNATLTTTWQRFTVSGTIATSANELTVLFNYTPTGTAGAADLVEITGVQLEVAASASAYSPNAGTFQGELAACQRYYLRDVGGATYSSYANGSGVVSTTEAYFDYKFKVTMRTTPSALEVSNVSVGDLNVGTFASTTITIAFGGVNSVNLKATTTGLTQYRPYQLLNTNNTAGYLGFSAEL